MSDLVHPLPKKRPMFGLVCCFCLIAAGCTADTAFVDIATLARAATPNDALACPPGFCAAKADFTTEIVPLSATVLAARVATELPAKEPRTELVARSDDGMRLVLVQRSFIFRFPDTVNIAVTEVDASHATLALYSRSAYGYGDFGVNRRRVKRWLGHLGIAYRGTE